MQQYILVPLLMRTGRSVHLLFETVECVVWSSLFIPEVAQKANN